MRNRKIDGLVPAETGIENVRDFHRAGIHAGSAEGAALQINAGGIFNQRHLQIVGSTLNGGDLGSGEYGDTVVIQPFSQADLSACVPVHHGQNPAHAAAVIRKLVIKL